jgi:nucleoid-associated protein YgaU
MDAPHTPPASAAGGDEHEVWVVGAGDSFWSIAEDVVGAGGDHVRAYWEQLIAANADRLAVPGQPDLLFPGQRLTLPPPATREG